jgi:hypothetical protein
MWSRMDSDDQLAVRTSLDWNVALEWVNAYFDAADSAMRLPSHAARKAAIERLERDFILRSKWGAAGHFVKGIGVLLPSNLESLRARVSLPFPPEDSIP